jgi:large subunit ribosomal protein L10
MVDTLKKKLLQAQSLVLVDFRGLTVEADGKMRREFRENGCEYRVVKNTLLGLAIKGTPLEVVDKLLAGPTAIAYSLEDVTTPARVAAKVAKDQEKFVIKGGYVDGRALDAKGVEALSTMPGKDEMRAKFLATLLAVPQNFMRILTAAQQSFLLLLQARARDQGGAGG